MQKISLKCLRVGHGLSLRDLVKETQKYAKKSGKKGISLKALHRLETGKTEPRPSTLKILSEVFQIPVEQIGT